MPLEKQNMPGAVGANVSSTRSSRPAGAARAMGSGLGQPILPAPLSRSEILAITDRRPPPRRFVAATNVEARPRRWCAHPKAGVAAQIAETFRAALALRYPGLADDQGNAQEANGASHPPRRWPSRTPASKPWQPGRSFLLRRSRLRLGIGAAERGNQRRHRNGRAARGGEAQEAGRPRPRSRAIWPAATSSSKAGFAAAPKTGRPLR